jgi:alanine racemase
VARIDHSAIRHNLSRVRAYAPRARIMAAIKADAYGHGALPVARALVDAGVDALAVACFEEAASLREAHVQAPIVLLEGVLSAAEAQLAAGENLHIVVHSAWQLALLQQQLPASAPLSIWFKLDTGMHRLGFAPEQAQSLYEAVRARRGWRLQGWFTHLACADDPDHPLTMRQIQLFERVTAGLPGARSIANSAGLIAWPQARADWVRPGLMLYGASPLIGKSAAELDLRPAMQLESRLITVKEVEAGETVGYGASYCCPERMRIGIVAVGYADGVHRVLPSGTPVLIQQQRVPIVGRVSMDMIAVDLRRLPHAQVGDPVLLWGSGLPAEEVAACAGTLAYELFCGLTRRVHYVHAP